ncbi:hypothetical protein M9Y10_020829 [Tritrichomonas musculus]|uniref:Protein kinase domain-containing protein n=1 Tax=Tritrichomonas musculus TaxID=1915356 RepID=A0ABR2HEN4_9EUKA
MIFSSLSLAREFPSYEEITIDQSNQFKNISIPHLTNMINKPTISMLNNAIEKTNNKYSFKNFIFNFNNFNKKELILKVYIVTDKNTGKEYAAHVSNIDLNQFSKKEMQDISEEMNIISEINYPSLAKLFGFSPVNFEGDPNPTFITEI